VARSISSRVRGALAILVPGLVLALPLAEVAVRALRLAPEYRFIDVTHSDTVYRRSANPVLAFELKPDWRDPDADLVRSYPFTNSHGLRDVERARTKPPGVRRILLLGASVVEGVGIRDLDDTMSRQAEALAGPGTEVLNFGVSAYCTRAKVELLRTKGLAFDPDVVVLVFARSDFDNFNQEAFQLGAAAPRPAAVERLFAASHAFRALATRLDLFGYRAQVDPGGWNAEAIGENNVVDGLRLLAALAREHGFAPLVAVWPRFTDDGIEDPGEMPGRPGELVVEALCRMEGIPSFRFSPYFQADRMASDPAGSPRRRYTIGDRIHPNREGCRVAARAVLEEAARAAEEFAGAEPSGRDEAAVAAARALGGVRPDESRRLVNVGNALLAEGKARAAIDAYTRALQQSPQLADAHHNLGVALRADGRPEAALLEFARAARLDPEHADAYLAFGVTLTRLGRPREAIPALERAVALRPGSAPAQRALEAARRAAGASGAPAPGPGGPPPDTTR
jgi:tetratricopeptide (TPR) repeat protein